MLISKHRGVHLGGNKFHKLSGYISSARQMEKRHLVTMAGAHSNHLRAFAAVASAEGFEATAVIRGEELADESRQSHEIRFARASGVRCLFVSRMVYRRLRESQSALERSGLIPAVDFQAALFIPEGGLGPDGLKGVRRWAAEAEGFATVWLPVATGTTAAGFLAATNTSTRVVGVAVLRNAAAIAEAIRWLAPGHESRFEMIGRPTIKFGQPSAKFEALAREYSQRWQLTIDATYIAPVIEAMAQRAESGLLQGKTLLVYTYNE